MKQTLIVLLLIAALLAACGPAPTPTPTVDIDATISAMSGTMVAGTLTAQPTATTPPTAKPRPSATPTLPLSTDTPTAAVAIPTVTPTAQAFIGCFAPSGTISLTAPFKLENFTKKTVSVFINGVTQEGDHTINCSYDLLKNSSVVFTLWWGKYTYWVEVPGKKIYQGSFWINDTDKATMQISDKGVKIGPFP